MIVTIGNTKGGVGKSTMSVMLAIAMAMTKRKVWLIDGDRQGTAADSIAMRSSSDQLPDIACTRFDHGPTLRAQVKVQGTHYDDIFIDAGGRDSTALRAALSICDVLIIPFVPRSVDCWALADIARIVEEARETRDGLKAFAVLNLADPGARACDNKDAVEAVQDFPGLDYLDAPLRRRKAFANAIGTGRCVLELAPRDIKACNEFLKLFRHLLDMQKQSFGYERKVHGNHQTTA